MIEATSIKISPDLQVPGHYNVKVDSDGDITFLPTGNEIGFTCKELEFIAKVAKAHRVAYNRYRKTDFQHEVVYYQTYQLAMEKY